MNINGIFNPENKFWSFMDKIMNLCVISLLWLVFSLPLVTAGASTTALLQYTMKLTANEEGYIWRTFFKGFKKNFIQATVLWCGILLCGGFLALDLYWCQFLALPRALRLGLFFAILSICMVFLLTVLWIFPLLAFYKVTVKKAVCHAFIMAMGNLYVSVTILVFYGIAAALTWFVPVLFMVWFALASYAASHFYRNTLERYLSDDGEEADFTM